MTAPVDPWAEVPWDERPAAQAEDDDPFAIPQQWNGRGHCPTHGTIHFQPGCPTCPPEGHPLQESAAWLRQVRRSA